MKQKIIFWYTWSVFCFEDIVTSGGRSSLDTLCMMFGNVACFPCLCLIITTSKEGSMFLTLLLNSTLTTKVNLWEIHCDISSGIELGSCCFLRVCAFSNKLYPFFIEKHELKAMCIVCSSEANFVPGAYRNCS